MPPIFLMNNRKLWETSSGSELTRSMTISDLSLAVKKVFNCYTFAFINVDLILKEIKVLPGKTTN